MAIWDPYLSETDRRVAQAAGYGAPGRLPARPALLVIDVTLDFCGPEGLDRVAAARACRTACGPRAWAAVPVIAGLIGAARKAGRPVIYTRRSPARLAARRGKTDRSGEDTARGNEIVAPLAPAPDEVVLGKDRPSAFWQTGLAAHLDGLEADGVLLTGGTTSGCVRATAVDAFNLGLPCAIVPEAVFDRFEASHALSLFDLSAKYADLIDAPAAAALLQGGYHAPKPLGSNSTPR